MMFQVTEPVTYERIVHIVGEAFGEVEICK